MKFFILTAFVIGVALGQNTLNQCLTNIREATEQFGGMMEQMMNDKKECKTQCQAEGRVNAAYETCFRDMTTMENFMKQGMQGFSRAVTQARTIVEGFVSNRDQRCSQSVRPGQGNLDQIALQQGGGEEKEEAGHLKGHFCKIAYMTRFFPEEGKDCMCKCMIKKWANSPHFRAEGLQLMPMLQEKLDWLEGRGPIPEKMKQHDIRHTAACIFKHCEKGAIEEAINQSGLRQMKDLMKNGPPPFIKQMMQQKCQCLATAAQQAGVQGAPQCPNPQAPEASFTKELCRGYMTDFVRDMIRHAGQLIQAGQLPGQFNRNF